jgi:uncharacterized repeat protein (TIGR03803 family)
MSLRGRRHGGTGIGSGTVFKLDPKGSETLLYSFGTVNGDGVFPQGELVMDSKGNLYGTTYAGSSTYSGVVFKVDPTGQERCCATLRVSMGMAPNHKGRCMDSAGNLYGTTTGGGQSGGGCPSSGCGTVVRPGFSRSEYSSFCCRP